MSFLEVLTGYAGRVQIGEIAVDASVNEAHGREAQVTEHPVESGADIADHYSVGLKALQVEGIISNTPIATGFPGTTLINSLNAIGAEEDPVKSAWSTIKQYFDDAEVITISTSLDEYPNMVLTSFSVERNSSSGQILRFSCSARELRIVSTSTTTAIPEPQSPSAASSAAKGKKPPTETPPAKTQSAAAKLLDKGLGFFQ